MVIVVFLCWCLCCGVLVVVHWCSCGGAVVVVCVVVWLW